MKQIIIALCFWTGVAGCEDTDLGLVVGAGIDVVTAITLSDEMEQIRCNSLICLSGSIKLIRKMILC